MAQTLNQVSNNEIFGVWLTRTNELLAALSANIVTTSLTANGALTSGNAVVNGMFAVNTLTTDTLRGGTLTTPNTLVISSNVSLGNNTIVLTDGDIRSGSFNASNTSTFVIDSFNRTQIRGAKYVMTVRDSTSANFQTSEILLSHNDANSFTTEYAQIIVGSSLGSFDSLFHIGNNTVQLTFTPSISNTFIKFIRTAINT